MLKQVIKVGRGKAKTIKEELQNLEKKVEVKLLKRITKIHLH